MFGDCSIWYNIQQCVLGNVDYSKAREFAIPVLPLLQHTIHLYYYYV